MNDAVAAASHPAAGKAGVSPLSGRFRFSTDALPPETRFDVWRDAVARPFLNVDAVAPAPRSFRANIDTWALDGALIASFDMSESRHERTYAMAGNSPDDVNFFITRRGEGLIEHDGDGRRVGKGSAVVVGCDRATTYGALDGGLFWNIKIQRNRLASLLPRQMDYGMRVLDDCGAAIGLLETYLAVVTRDHGDQEGLAPPAMALAGNHIIDLVALALKPSRDGAEQIRGRGLKAARTEAVLAAIARGHADPAFSIDRVALDLGLTPRQVHRLIEETPKTFSEHVLETRLLRAHEMLADPAWVGLNVGDIALKAGFGDVPAFNRAFRTRFGETPMAVRVQAARSRLAQ
jgi:AraC-like DNA-binding protein